MTAGVQNGNAFYACSIDVLQTGGAPITAPLIFDEMLSTASGASASQYIMNLQGTPPMPNGWNCQMPPFANSASCSISAANFNGNTGHRIDALISIPTGVLAKEGLKNCAQVRIGDQVVGSDCVDIVLPQETTFKIEKSCKPSGDRMNLSPTIWFQPYQCSLIVTTNGVPFTGPLWVTEDLHFGASSGVGSIQNITSADPWNCSSPPYTASGQGNDPACSIQGAQFPISGTSTLTVDLTMNSAMDYFGAENCVSLSVGEPTANGLPAPVASDCFEIAPPPTPIVPQLGLSKTCAPAIRGPNGIWTAHCQVTVTLDNFQPDPNSSQFYYIDLIDELVPNGIQTPLTSLMPLQTPTFGCCWGPFTGTPPGYNTARITAINLMAHGGSVTLPYTATFSGPGGRPVNGPNMQNCVSATFGAMNLRAPQGPLGNERLCVPITFPMRAIADTPAILDPVTPTSPGLGGADLTFIKEQTAPCEANRNSQTYSCGFRLSVTNTGTTPYLGPLVMTDMGGAPGMTSARAVSGNGWTCGRAVANSVSCTNPAVNLMPGASTFVDLRMKVKGLRHGGAFPNCGIAGVTENRTQRVALIQKIMNDRGYNAGGVDGAPGRRTYAALAKLRRGLGLPINRKFDDALFEALGLPLQQPGTSSCVSAKLPAMPPRFVAPTPKPTPTPNQPALKCDLRSTYPRGNICACIDQRNAKNISKTQCGCGNGLPMINGKCIAINIVPKLSGKGPAGAEGCRLKIGGICIQ